MKRLSLFLLMLSGLTACVKEATPETFLNESPGPVAQKTYTGNFVNGPYGNVNGKAHVVQDSAGNLQIQLEGLASSNGPDLRVYLSKETQPVNFINLGMLRSVNGTQLYPLAGQPDFALYKYVLIHCQAYNHLFGSALLIKN